jgi:protein TonB
LRTGIEGTTRLQLTVAADGSVKDTEVEQSSGNDELDKAAMNCAKSWHYKPAMQNGRPVEALTQADVIWHQVP